MYYSGLRIVVGAFLTGAIVMSLIDRLVNH